MTDHTDLAKRLLAGNNTSTPEGWWAEDRAAVHATLALTDQVRRIADQLDPPKPKKTWQGGIIGDPGPHWNPGREGAQLLDDAGRVWELQHDGWHHWTGNRWSYTAYDDLPDFAGCNFVGVTDADRERVGLLPKGYGCCTACTHEPEDRAADAEDDRDTWNRRYVNLLDRIRERRDIYAHPAQAPIFRAETVADELAALLPDGGERPMNDDTVNRAAEVLIAHIRTTIEFCHCGWADLGKSHAEHVAQALADAGLLVSEQEVQERELAAAATALLKAADWLDDQPTARMPFTYGRERDFTDGKDAAAEQIAGDLRGRADRLAQQGHEQEADDA